MVWPFPEMSAKSVPRGTLLAIHPRNTPPSIAGRAGDRASAAREGRSRSPSEADVGVVRTRGVLRRGPWRVRRRRLFPPQARERPPPRRSTRARRPRRPRVDPHRLSGVSLVPRERGRRPERRSRRFGREDGRRDEARARIRRGPRRPSRVRPVPRPRPPRRRRRAHPPGRPPAPPPPLPPRPTPPPPPPFYPPPPPPPFYTPPLQERLDEVEALALTRPLAAQRKERPWLEACIDKVQSVPRLIKLN